MESICSYCGASDKFRCKSLAEASRCSSFQVRTVEQNPVSEDEYEGLTDFDWIQYELATIFYDYRVSPEAQQAIIRCIRNYLHE